MPLHVSSTRARRQEVKIALYSLWHHHTETSEWSKITKITKIQLYKYEHIVVYYKTRLYALSWLITTIKKITQSGT
jgi:hypothetical protein